MDLILSILPLLGMPGITEMLIIGGAVVLLFGATKLPKLGKGLGEGIRNFKAGLSGGKGDAEKKEADSAEIELATKSASDENCKA